MCLDQACSTPDTALGGEAAPGIELAWRQWLEGAMGKHLLSSTSKKSRSYGWGVKICNTFTLTCLPARWRYIKLKRTTLFITGIFLRILWQANDFHKCKWKMTDNGADVFHLYVLSPNQKCCAPFHSLTCLKQSFLPLPPGKWTPALIFYLLVDKKVLEQYQCCVRDAHELTCLESHC